MSNYPFAWHTNMKYLKLLLSDKLSTVRVNAQQAPSICNVGRTIKRGNDFPDKSSTPKEPQNSLLRHGLDLRPIQTAGGGFTVTTNAKYECNDGTVCIFMKASDPGGLHSFSCSVMVEHWTGQTWWSSDFPLRKQIIWNQYQLWSYN